MELVKRGEGMDIVWTMTSEARERELLPIRVPLMKGLIGLRLLLIHQDDQGRFEQIGESRQLKALKAGQGHDWPDTKILGHNGYVVTASASYDGLFKMLGKRRIDYFPRSVLEIWREVEHHDDKGLAVESSVALQYPAAEYFFVNKENAVLARRLEEGLQRAIADGSFDRLFFEYFGDLLERSRLEDRVRFELENPLLPAETPVGQRDFWYQY